MNTLDELGIQTLNPDGTERSEEEILSDLMEVYSIIRKTLTDTGETLT